MIRNAVVAVFVGCACLGASTEEKVLAVFPNDELPQSAATSGSLPGVTASVDSAAPSGGNGSIKVTSSGGRNPDVLLFQAELSGIENCVLWCEATMKSEEVAGRAYLDMWVTFPDGKSYFSRGLDQVFTGTQDWRRCRIPFFLKMGESPSSVAMGVQFEGTGAVWLNDVRLVQEQSGVLAARGYPSQLHDEEVQQRLSREPARRTLRDWLRIPGYRGAALGILGGAYGALAGIWGGIVGFLAPKGKGRRFVLISGIGFLIVGILSLLGGIFCLLRGSQWAVWYPLLLSGGIGVVLFGLLLPVVLRRYRQAEAQRLQAQDLAENL